MALDEQLLAQLQGVDMNRLPMKMSTPQGFHSQFGDMVGGEPQISDAILNHLQNNMGLNVDAVSMDDLIQVVQEQVDQLAQQTESLLSKFRRTQSGLQQAADTMAQVDMPPPGMEGGLPPMGGELPPPPDGGAPPPEGAPPPPAEEPMPPPPAEEPPPPPEGEVSDAGLKEVEGAAQEAVEEGEMSDEEFEDLLKYIEAMHVLLEEHGDKPAPVEEETSIEEAMPSEDEFDGENLSQLMAGINKRF